MRTRARALCAALAAALGFAPALARAGDDPFARGLWPFWVGDALPWAGVRETRARRATSFSEKRVPGISRNSKMSDLSRSYTGAASLDERFKA